MGMDRYRDRRGQTGVFSSWLGGVVLTRSEQPRAANSAQRTLLLVDALWEVGVHGTTCLQCSVILSGINLRR